MLKRENAMYRSTGWRYGYRSHRHSPWMGLVFLVVITMLFTKGLALILPLVLIGLGIMMLKGRGWEGFCDGDMGEKFKHKRDQFFGDEEKSKRYYVSNDDTEPIDYI